MLKIPISDLIEEVKAEILCYEDENVAEIWEQKFTKLIKQLGGKKSYIKKDGQKTYYIVKDESEIFSLADNYVAALSSGEEEAYWKGF